MDTVYVGNALYHHGVKGMKWGVRRYQNPDGTLTKAGHRRAAKRYDYKKSDSYKNSTSAGRAFRTRQYNVNKARYGSKAANKIEYEVDNKIRSRKSATRRAFAGQVAKGLGSYALAGGSLAAYGHYHNAKAYAGANNTAANTIGKDRGLNTVKGRPTFGFAGVKRGKAVYERSKHVTRDFEGFVKERQASQPIARNMIEQWKDVKYKQVG